MSFTDPVLLLTCYVQHYDWGVKGAASLVARLKACQSSSALIDANKPYAELWAGTHPRLESSVALSGKEVPLSEYLKHQSLPDLTYLLKVLSVGKALSIQVHPNLAAARRLHTYNPAQYPDANHKPELAIALGNFKALVGIRDFCEISELLKALPLANVIGKQLIRKLEERDPETLKMIIRKLLVLDNDPQQLKSIFEEILVTEHSLKRLFTQLHTQHGFDVGCFFVYIMNLVELKEGEAIFIDAGTPHAYLQGDIVECMASSDNVVRCGLTPKYKDLDTLFDIMEFSSRKIDTFVSTTKLTRLTRDCDGEIVDYTPPVKEFKVTKVKIQSVSKATLIAKVWGGSTLLVVDGQAHLVFSGDKKQKFEAKKGCVYFFKEMGNLMVESISNTTFQAYIAQTNTYS